MSRFPRLARYLAAGTLAVSTLTVFAASPASAAVTASIAEDGAGGVVVTYSGVTSTDSVVVVAVEATAACSASTPVSALFFLTTDPQAPGGQTISASPFTIAVGGPAFRIAGGYGPMTIAAGTYNFCLQSLSSGTPAQLGSLVTTLGTAPTTTTTTVVEEPAVPTYTG